MDFKTTRSNVEVIAATIRGAELEDIIRDHVLRFAKQEKFPKDCITTTVRVIVDGSKTAVCAVADVTITLDYGKLPETLECN